MRARCPSAASEFRRLLDDNGLAAPSAHLDFSDPGAAFAQAHALGAHYAASGSLRALVPGTIGYELLLAETDAALVQFEIDCGWMVVGGRNPIDYFERFPHRFPMIHADLKHYFAEQEGPFTRMSQLEAARQAFDYLRRIP